VKSLLERIYGTKEGDMAYRRLRSLIDKVPQKRSRRTGLFSQEDIFLITYGDTLLSSEPSPKQTPLKIFHRFANRYLKGTFSTIHFLPFFPFSSDDGFAVIDYYTINPELGIWQDVRDFRTDFQLMFDYVLNHISAQSPWFQNYLADRKGYDTLAIEIDPATDLSMVTRPRPLPLLTEFKKESGETVHLWTTFSSDQVDLNYASIEVLEKMIDVMLFYIAQGATVLRLDAIAYLWKTVGTSCIHLPQTHDMIRLFRRILDQVAPDVILITETNVPHEENVSYFGDGSNEAQMVYNFTLPPLLLYTFIKEDATLLSRWAGELATPSENTTFFNFTASHDGIGVRPLEGIVPGHEIDRLVQTVKQNGGSVSLKQNPDGTQSPYELNITYIDALLKPGAKNDPHHVNRFLASQAIAYVLPWVPATYINMLI
jgi:sucrose phosphorylase